MRLHDETVITALGHAKSRIAREVMARCCGRKEL